jgi:hypothetical protein
MAVHSSRTSPAPEFEEDQPMYPDKTEAVRPVRPADDASPEPRRREHGVQMTFADEVAPALRASTSLAVRRPVPRASPDVSLAPFPAPTHKPANRELFIWSVVLFALAGLCVLGAPTLYRTASRSVSVTAESARDVMPLAVAARGSVQRRRYAFACSARGSIQRRRYAFGCLARGSVQRWIECDRRW